MSSSPFPTLSSAPLSPQAKELLGRFDSLWQRERPSIDDFLAACPEAERLTVLTELVHSDLEFRLRAKEPARVEDYLRRYPELAAQPQVVAHLRAAEVRLRCRYDPTHDPADSQQRSSNPAGPAGPLTQGHPSGETTASFSARTVTQPTHPLPGQADTESQAIKGYEILAELGRGGMGVVYKARQVRLNRIVALKMVLSGPAASPEELARFHTEGEAVARLQHPNIVQIFDCGEREGRPYFALEFVEGGSLAGKLKGRPLPPREAARLVQTLACAMQHAHQQQVLHRDLKPANILLTGDGTPKITDFGLARWLDDVGQTASGMVLGSVPYLAPEQANGRASQMGPPTDVFGLGAILYECLTGRPPYHGSDRMALWQQARQGQVVPPRQLNRQVPRLLQRICLKALAADPGQRYASAAELERALGSYLRRPLWLLAGLAILLLTPLLVLAAMWARPQQQPQLEPRDQTQVEQPLDGDLLIGVYSREQDSPKQGVLVDQTGALPVRNGERVHLEVRLNRPGHIYLLWIDSTGEVQPLYPWDPKKQFKEPPPALPPTQVVHRPEEINRGYRVKGPTGLETVLLLVSRSPLRPDMNLETEIGRFPAARRFSDPREVNWWELLPGQPAGRLTRTLHRGNLEVEETEEINSPVLHLLERLRPHFDLIKAVRFTHQGD